MKVDIFCLVTANDAFSSDTGSSIKENDMVRPSRLLNGLSEYMLTYEDRDGDWMLVGDVPWGYTSFSF